LRILLTGASSFTGLWFAQALARAGHSVVAVARAAAYADGLRQARMDRVAAVAEVATGAPFGSDAFLAALQHRGPFDVLALHGAEVGDYKSPSYDLDAAAAANTLNVDKVFAAARAGGASRVVLTGTVFEPGEGRGTEPLVSFSPYGTSKAKTAEIVRAAAEAAGLAYAKFVIPNPFGPWEERRFQRLVMTRWSKGEGVHIDQALYVRDNVPVDLMALAYAATVEGRFGAYCAPSCYAEPVGAFFERMARQVRARTGWACPLTLAETQVFAEPEARTNLTALDAEALGWSEAAFWDAYVDHYLHPPLAL
jgi:nucleoside-diphosphate-sugar epimerase